MKELLFAMCCFLIMSQTVMAENKSDAEIMIRDALDKVILILREEDLSRQDKGEKITDIVSPMFDFSKMAMLTLGKKYWPELTGDQKIRFTDLFVKRLKDSYTEKLMLYTDEKVIFESSVLVKKKFHIQTYLLTKEDEKISILYKLYQPGNCWKIYDIEIQGVSMIRSYQSDYHDILKKSGVDGLFKKLEESLDS